MRIGVFGGSFDPVHLGHLALAEHCQAQARLDQVLFLPAAHQPLKTSGPVASDADRLAMLRLAINDREEFEVSALELDRGGVSYTVDSLRELHRQAPAAELFFLMGADALADFASWREPRAICELACPLIVSRARDRVGRAAPQSADAQLELLAPFASPQRMAEIRSTAVDMPDVPISSSEIRRLISEGGPWEPLVPAAVAEYIRARRVYQK